MKHTTKRLYKYHYFYKITNNINNRFYYGIHSTNNLDDGYMGSGLRLHYAFKKHGMENFTKEILKFFDTREECAMYEAEIVNENLINDPNCYNVILGGEYLTTLGVAIVKDKDGNRFGVPVSDPRYLSGELTGATKDIAMVKDKGGNGFGVPVSDPRYLSGELVGVTKGKISAKDKYGKYYFVSIDDKRYINGELTPIWKNRHHSEESKQKMRETCKIIKHQQGEKNSQFGTCWITKDGVNKKIKQTELDIYLANGWIKGRKIK